jgi:hypothetical protein
VLLHECELRKTAFLVSTEILILIIVAVAGASAVFGFAFCSTPAAPRLQCPDVREDDIEAAS